MKSLVPMVAALALSTTVASAQQDAGRDAANSGRLKASQPVPTERKTDQDVVPERLAPAEAISYDYLAQRMGAHGIADVNALETMRVVEDEKLLSTHTHVQQTFQGVPVFGGEAIVHLSADGSLSGITDDLVSAVNVNALPTLTKGEAIRIAVKKYGCKDCLTAAPTADLWVLRHKRRDHLVYEVQLQRLDGSPDTAIPVYFIDAHTGALVWTYNDLQTGTGSSLYSGTVTINTFFINNSQGVPTFFMEDHIRNVGTFDNAGTEGTPFYFTDPDNNWNAANQRAGVDAHFGTGKALDYYKSKHGRRGFDGRGGPVFYGSADGQTGLISTRVHYGNRLNNGFFDGNTVVLGDGDGSQNGPNVSLDWLGHEWTHAVTKFTANLVYSGESGALNESWSDVFGAMIERFAKGESSNTWKLFEQTYTPRVSGDAERDMNNPHQARNKGFTADDDPDHYSERYTGAADNGGVHINSGIANKAFYLVAKGGSHHKGGSMTGIGADKAAKIWYKALTTYMTRTTNFKGARTATLNAAKALYGTASAQYTAVGQAWSLCGVN